MLSKARLHEPGWSWYAEPLGMPVKPNKNQPCDYMTTEQSRLTGISVTRAEKFPCNSAYLAIPANRDSKNIFLRTNLFTFKLSVFSLNTQGTQDGVSTELMI